MQRIIGILIFVGLVFLGDRMGGRLLAELVEQSQFRYSRLYNGEANAKILLIGNSRGLSFFQPSIEATSGQSTFNFSYNAMPVDLAKVLVEDYLDRYQTPEIAIIDITLCDRFNQELVAGFSPYYKYSDRLPDLIRTYNTKLWRASQVTHLFRYNSEVFQRALYYYKQSDEDWLLDRKITSELIAKVENPDYSYFIDYPKETLYVFKELVEVLQEKGVQVRLVINPYFPTFRKKMTNLDQLKKEIEEKLKLPVFDYSTTITGKENFGDFQHLNKKGSEIYINLLNEEGFFQSSRLE